MRTQKANNTIRNRGRAARNAGTGFWGAVLGAGAIVTAAAGLLWLTSPGATRQGSGIGGPFRLVADDGRLVTERSFAGKYLAVYFGYTSCRDVCPATLNTLTAALARLGERSLRVQPLFITVDPSRDSPAVLRRYVGHFSPQLRGLTGPANEVARVARAYGVVTMAAGGVLDHNSVILLFSPNGRLVAPLPADASEMVMTQELARYVPLT